MAKSRAERAFSLWRHFQKHMANDRHTGGLDVELCHHEVVGVPSGLMGFSVLLRWPGWGRVKSKGLREISANLYRSVAGES